MRIIFYDIIDETMIFNRALTQEEIAWIYNKGKPVGQWKFDEGEGSTAYDSTDNNKDCTITGADWVQGKFGSALDFDGNDYVSVGDTDQKVKTISLWLKTDALNQKILDLDGGTHYIEIDSNGKIIAQGFSSPTYYLDGILTTSPVIDLNWHHIEILTSTEFEASNVTFGKVGTNYYDGRLDDIRIYNYVRSQSQILQDYNAGLSTHFK